MHMNSHFSWIRTIRCKKLTTVVCNWKKVARTFVGVMFWHSCLPVFAWEKMKQSFIDSKQLFRVSCILCYYYSKWHSIILQVARLWCFIIISYLFQFKLWEKLHQCHIDKNKKLPMTKWLYNFKFKCRKTKFRRKLYTNWPRQRYFEIIQL